MKKIAGIAMALSLISIDLSAQNTRQTMSGTKSTTMQQDTSRNRTQDTSRDRQLNERNRTNRIDTGAVSPVDTAINRIR